MSESVFNKVERNLRKSVWGAIKDFNLIEKGDKIMVCLSGGKDSYTMLDILLHVQRTKIYEFDIIAVNLDQKQPGFPEEVLPNYLSEIGVEYKIYEKDTYSVVKSKIEEGKTMCSLCSRLRRGNLYSIAEELGATKLALGHHRDDILETFMLNLFFNGKLETMPPKFQSNDGKHVIIRPLAYCKESEIEVFAKEKQFPIIPCTLCGSQANLQRVKVKQMLQDWEGEYKDRMSIMFTALKNVSPTHLLDPKLYDFINLENIIEEDNKSKHGQAAPSSYIDPI